MRRHEAVVVAFPRPLVEVSFPAWPTPARTVRALMPRDAAAAVITLLLVPVGIAILAAMALAALLAVTLLAPVLAVLVTVGAWRSARAPGVEPTAPPRRTPPALRASPARSPR